MKWFVRFSPLLLLAAYGFYFTCGFLNASTDWKKLEKSFLAQDKVQAKAAVRKDVTKYIYYSKNQLREALNFQAQDSTLYMHSKEHSLLLQEELESVTGLFWDVKKQRAFHLHFPCALFDYSKKNLTGYQAKLEEFDLQTNSFIGKGDFAEVECNFKNEPAIKLKRIHAQVFTDP